jgi:hypothetical protein
MWRLEMSKVRSNNCKDGMDRGERTDDASKGWKQGEREASLVAMLVDSNSLRRGKLMGTTEAVRGRMDEQPQEDVMAQVAQWRSAVRLPPWWPPPHEESTSSEAKPQPRDVLRPEAWLAAAQKLELCQIPLHLGT